MDSAVRETPSSMCVSALGGSKTRPVSTAVVPTSTCLRVGGWASTGKSLESFIFPSEIETFSCRSADCTEHVHGNAKTKYVQDNILLAALGTSHTVCFSFRGDRMPYPAGHHGEVKR